MTLHILFLTVTIKKRELSKKQADQQEMVRKLYEEHRDRQLSMQQYM